LQYGAKGMSPLIENKKVRSVVLTVSYADVLLFWVIFVMKILSIWRMEWNIWMYIGYIFIWAPLMVFGIIMILNLEFDIEDEKDKENR
jgi:hypothetical protein